MKKSEKFKRKTNKKWRKAIKTCLSKETTTKESIDWQS